MFRHNNLTLGLTNPRPRIGVATKLVAVATQRRGWLMLRCLEIYRWLLGTWKVAQPCLYVYTTLHFDAVPSELFTATNPTLYLHPPVRMARIGRNMYTEVLVLVYWILY
jgi:hypothetical protein